MIRKTNFERRVRRSYRIPTADGCVRHQVREIEAAVEQTADFFANTKKLKPANPEGWDLIHYIEIARELKEISEETASQARLAKDFRNLIHPGRERRRGMRCDRGTAYSVAAAVQHVMRDLSEKQR